MKKILIIDDYNQLIGGTQVYIYNVVPLLKDKFEISVFQGDLPRNKFQKALSSLYSIKYKRRIRQIINTFKPDVLWIHSIERNISPSFLLNKNINGIRIVLTIPDVSQYFWTISRLANPLFFYEIIKKIFFRKIIKARVDKYIAVSSFMAKRIQRDLNIVKEKIVLIENPSFIKRKKKTSLHTDILNVIFVGRLDGKKGEFFLLKAMDELKHDQIVLNMYGEGKEMMSLKRFVDCRTLSNVHLRGNVSMATLKDAYLSSDVCVALSSVEESASLVIREAFSMGLPVIATNIGAQSELVKEGKNGFKVGYGDVEVLVQDLKVLIQDKTLLGNMSDKAFMDSEEFDLEDHITKLVDFFDSI